jgi:hypothetical protein
VTAAHCVYWPAVNDYIPQGDTPAPPVGFTGLDTFLPGRTGARLPYGRWPIEGAWIDPIWRTNGDPRYDVAFLRLGTRAGRTPEQALGAHGVIFDGQAGHPAVVLGYPVPPPFDGTLWGARSRGLGRPAVIAGSA